MKKTIIFTALAIWLFLPVAAHAVEELTLSITGEDVSGIVNGFNRSQKRFRVVVDNQKYRNWRFAINRFRFSQERAEYGSSDRIIDIAFIDNNWICAMVDEGWLENITGKIKEDNNFIKGLSGAGKKDGKIYALPFSNKGLVLFYRKDLHEKYKLPPPKDMEQLVKNAVLLMKKEGFDHGLTIHYSAIHLDILPFLWSNGGGIIENGKVIIKSRENIEALSYLRKLAEKRILPGNKDFMNLKGAYSNAKKLFINGSSPYIITWNNRISDFENSQIKGKFRILSIPSLKPEQKSFSIIGSWYFAVNSFSKNKDCAFLFLNYFLKDDVQLDLALKSNSFIPASKTIYSNSMVREKNPFLEELGYAMSNMRHRLKHPKEPRINLVFESCIKEIIVNGKPVEEMLDIAQNKVEAIIKN